MTGRSDAMGDDSYTLGYGRAVMSWLLARTPESHAPLLLPHLKPGASLLDCGSGPGKLTMDFAVRLAPGEVVGIDIEATQVAAANEAARSKNLHNVRFEQASIYELPFTDETFDLSFCGAVLGHLREPRRAVAEIHRVLKPGGLAVFREFDNAGDLFFPRPPLIDKSIRLYADMLTEKGQHRDGGRKLKSWLRGTGFALTALDATFEVFDSASYSEAAAVLYREQLGPYLVSTGRLTPGEVDEIVEAWHAMRDDPDAFIAAAWVDAAARKPR